MKLPYYHVDAFASRPFTGNQAAVIPLDHWPDDAVLQAIGEENNFAETAFTVPDQSIEADYELRWFTPEIEIDLCGHATLASGHVLLSEQSAGQDNARDQIRFRTRKAGILIVKREASGAKTNLQNSENPTDPVTPESGIQNNPEGDIGLGTVYALDLPAQPPGPPLTTDAIPEFLGLIGGKPQEIARHGEKFYILAYKDAEEVQALRPDMKALAALGHLQFIATAPGRKCDFESRVFVPGAGVDEDSVTGSAHTVLTPYWAERLGRDDMRAFQASRRGGHLTCRLDGDRVWLGGSCVTVVEGIFHLR